jgi:Starch-binding associating with outer membrane
LIFDVELSSNIKNQKSKIKEKMYLFQYKKQYLVLTLLVLAALFSSCDKYLDVNTDPTRVGPESVTLASILPTAIEATSRAQYLFAFSECQIAQQIAGAAANGQADTHDPETRFGGAWTSVYLNAMSNLNTIIQRGQTLNAPHYAGVAKVLMALNLGTASDAWGDIPYSQAFSIANIKPTFDTQESVYTAIQRLLDEAIVDLGAAVSAASPAADDLALAGNRPRWIRVARALKARYAIHLSPKGAVAAGNAAANAISAGGMTGNADDLQLVYNTRNLNPWHSGVALPINTGNLTVRHADQFINSMNGTTGAFDPRLPILADRRANTTWRGNRNGAGTGGTCDLTTNTWYARADAPILMVTFAEQKFIEAEAEFLKANGTATSVGAPAAAYNAYLAGITAHMQKLGVADTARTRYLADPRVAVGAAALKLSNIMVEKHKALFLNPEVWTDMRRYDYAVSVYPGLQLPENHNPTLNKQWIQRAGYPLDEIARNGDNVKRVEKPISDKMWWAR